MKKSIFNSTDNHEIISRIRHLSPDTKAKWGKMNPAQMLAHLQAPIHVAFGDIKLKRGLLGVMFGGMAKRKMTGSEPFKKSLPTDKQFIVKDKRDFEEEKKKLTTMLHKLADERAYSITKEPHPFFGRLTTEEWDILIWKHLDHHLKQFGV